MLNWKDWKYLQKEEVGERLDLARGVEWLCKSLPYQDFSDLFTIPYRTEHGHHFSYEYCISEEDDSPKARLDYLKYLLYKVVQNDATEGIMLDS